MNIAERDEKIKEAIANHEKSGLPSVYCLDEIRSLMSQPVESVSDAWLPIAEAPRDGTRLLIANFGWGDHAAPTIAHWDGDSWCSCDGLYSDSDITHFAPLLKMPKVG
jgi:hypothetical protein